MDVTTYPRFNPYSVKLISVSNIFPVIIMKHKQGDLYAKQEVSSDRTMILPTGDNAWKGPRVSRTQIIPGIG